MRERYRYTIITSVNKFLCKVLFQIKNKYTNNIPKILPYPKKDKLLEFQFYIYFQIQIGITSRKLCIEIIILYTNKST